jgi:hypothetical protein
MATAQARSNSLRQIKSITSTYGVFADEVDVKSLTKEVITLASYLYEALFNASNLQLVKVDGAKVKIEGSCIRWDPTRHCWVPC